MDLFDRTPPGDVPGAKPTGPTDARAGTPAPGPSRASSSEARGETHSEARSETLEGTVDRIVFTGGGGEFTVARLGVEGGGDPVTIVGSLLGIPVGARLRVTGRRETNPRFGMQFRVTGYTEMA
ncbi:MAG: hypothetical protein ABJA82_18445, partial [Myxococcales bacterium]